MGANVEEIPHQQEIPSSEENLFKSPASLGLKIFCNSYSPSQVKVRLQKMIHSLKVCYNKVWVYKYAYPPTFVFSTLNQESFSM